MEAWQFLLLAVPALLLVVSIVMIIRILSRPRTADPYAAAAADENGGGGAGRAGVDGAAAEADDSPRRVAAPDEDAAGGAAPVLADEMAEGADVDQPATAAPEDPDDLGDFTEPKRAFRPHADEQAPFRRPA